MIEAILHTVIGHEIFGTQFTILIDRCSNTNYCRKRHCNQMSHNWTNWLRMELTLGNCVK